MKFVLDRPYGSFSGELPADELPDFVVLTGSNGAGKSQFLEGIRDGAIYETSLGDFAWQMGNQIKHLSIGQLMPPGEQLLGVNSFDTNWVLAHQRAQEATAQVRAQHGDQSSVFLDREIQTALLNGQVLSLAGVDKLLRMVGKPFSQFSKDDYRNYVPLISSIKDLFGLSATELFLSYHSKFEGNEYRRYLKEVRHRNDINYLNDDQFLQAFGPPPWTLLNSVFRRFEMPYQFDHPEGYEATLQYEAKLTLDGIPVPIRTAQLSSGEKTILALVMAVFTSDRNRDSLRWPALLLLDEPDASLHPTMVPILLDILQDALCDSLNIKIIMTTHSPTTVALAPASSLYEMRRSGTPRLRSISPDVAIRNLTTGVPTLSIRIANKRHVFVESEYDEACYQAIYTALKGALPSPLSLQFVASGMGGKGDCNLVMELVKRLRDSGNENVHGIIDRDTRSSAPVGIHINYTRYSLENIAFDPLLLGCVLLRERITPPASVGLISRSLHRINSADAQNIVTFVSRSLNMTAGPQVDILYRNGWACSVSEGFLSKNGHELEEAVLKAFPELKKFQKSLKPSIFDLVLSEVPEFTPADLFDLMVEVSTL